MTKIVQIAWADSTSYASPAWRSDIEGVGCIEILTVGWLIKKTRSEVILAQSISEDGSAGGVFVIPRGCIKEIKKLG